MSRELYRAFYFELEDEKQVATSKTADIVSPLRWTALIQIYELEKKVHSQRASQSCKKKSFPVNSP